MNNIIICGFACVGKTYVAEKYGWHDIDHTEFAVTYDVEHQPRPSPFFPDNLITHLTNLKETSDKPILLDYNELVVSALESANLQWIHVHPHNECKDEYVERCKRVRPWMASTLEANWDEIIDECYSENRNTEAIILRKGEYLDDEINTILVYTPFPLVEKVVESPKYKNLCNHTTATLPTLRWVRGDGDLKLQMVRKCEDCHHQWWEDVPVVLNPNEGDWYVE